MEDEVILEPVWDKNSFLVDENNELITDDRIINEVISAEA